MAKKLKGITLPISADYTGLQEALERAESNIRGVQGELRNVNSALKWDPNNINLLSEKSAILKDRLAETEAKLKSLKEAYNKMSEDFANGNEDVSEGKMRELRIEIERTEGQLKNFGDMYEKVNDSIKNLELPVNKFKEFGEKAKEFGGKVVNTGDKMQNMGGKLAPASIAITGLFTLASKEALSFDNALINVKKTTNASEEELASYKEELTEMSEELGVSRDELGNTMSIAAQLGVSGKDLVPFTRAVTDLAISTDMSSEEAAQWMAQIMNMSDLPINEVGKLGSVAVALGNNLATSEKPIMEIAKRLFGVAKNAGFADEEVFGLAGTFASLGMEPQAAAGALSQVIMKMQQNVESAGPAVSELEKAISKSGKKFADVGPIINKGGKELKAFAEENGLTVKQLKSLYKEAVKASEGVGTMADVAGMTGDEFVAMFKSDPCKALQLFIEGLGKLDKNGGSAVNVLKDLEMGSVNQSRALLSASNSTELFAKSNEIAKKAIKEGTAAAEEASQFYNSSSQNLKKSQEKIKTQLIKIGEKVIPVFSRFVEGFGDVVKKIVELDDKTDGLLVKAGIVTAVSSPILKTVGGITKGTGHLIEGLGILTGKLGGTAKATDGVVSSGKDMRGVFSPTGLVVLGLAAVAGAAKILHDEMYKLDKADIIGVSNNYKEFGDILKNAEPSIKDFTEVEKSMLNSHKELQAKVAENEPKITKVLQDASEGRRAYTEEEFKLIKDVTDGYEKLADSFHKSNKAKLDRELSRLNSHEKLTKETYAQQLKNLQFYTQEEKRVHDEAADKMYETVYEAQKRYEEALASGNKTEIEKTKEHYRSLDLEYEKYEKKFEDDLQKTKEAFIKSLDNKYMIGREKEQERYSMFAQKMKEYKDSLETHQKEIEEAEKKHGKTLFNIRDSALTEEQRNLKESLNGKTEEMKGIWKSLEEDTRTHYASMALIALNSNQEMSDEQINTLSYFLAASTELNDKGKQQILDGTRSMLDSINGTSSEGLSKTEEIVGKISGVLNDYNGNIKDFEESLKKSASQHGKDVDAIVDSNIKAIEKNVREGNNSILNASADGGKDLTKQAETTSTDIKNKLNTPEDYKKIGSDNTKSLKEGMEFQGPEIKSVTKLLMDEAMKEAKKTDSKSVGEDIAKGLGEGMRLASSLNIVTSAAYSLGELALKTVRKVLDINSPSKKTIKLGKFTSDGLAIGIRENAGEVKDEFAYLQSIIDNFNNEVSSVNAPEIRYGVQRAAMSDTYLASQNQVNNSMTFNLNDVVVREEADIDKIRREIEKFYRREARGGVY